MISLLLAGGGGTRLWPFSTEKNPKQFQDLLSPGISMLTQTLHRLQKASTFRNIYIATAEKYGEQVINTTTIKNDNLILEPCRRNNAAAIALALLRIWEQTNEEEIIGVFPAEDRKSVV